MSQNIISKKRRKQTKKWVQSAAVRVISNASEKTMWLYGMATCGRNRRQRPSANALASVARCAPPDFRSSFLLSVSTSSVAANFLHHRFGDALALCWDLVVVVVAFLVSFYFLRGSVSLKLQNLYGPYQPKLRYRSTYPLAPTARWVYLILFMDSPSAVHKIQFLCSYSN